MDSSPRAIDLATAKADERGLSVRFVVWDALQLGQSDPILASGLYHVFDDTARARYTNSLKSATLPGSQYFLLCFSDREPGEWGPRRVTQDEINKFQQGLAHRVNRTEHPALDD